LAPRNELVESDAVARSRRQEQLIVRVGTHLSKRSTGLARRQSANRALPSSERGERLAIIATDPIVTAMCGRDSVLRLPVLAGAMAAAIVAGPSPLRAEDGPAHRIVFEMTSDQPPAWEVMLNNVENVRAAFPGTTEVEVVFHGKALPALMPAKNRVLADRMKRIANAGVVFAACENTMKRVKVARSDLFPFARTVDSGIAEVVRKQEGGWSYIRMAP
jgi:uncharacterized protein